MNMEAENTDWRARLCEMLKLHEGLRLKPYYCTAGRRTIGYGHNLEAHGNLKLESITIGEAEFLLDADIKSAERLCRERLPFDFEALSDVRKAVLVDMCFNLGIGGLCGFKNTLSLIRDGQYNLAADAMLKSKWAEQVGKSERQRAGRLSAMMSTNEWPADLPV
jgi:lysozyme